MRKQGFARVTGFLLSLALCLLGLAVILEGLGTGGELMLSLMLRYAPPISTGLPEEEYPGMCRMITQYLAGNEETFQYVLTGAGGTQYLCFHDYEQAHMADVRSLFVLDRTVLLISAAVCAVLIALTFHIRKKKGTLQGLRDGALAVILLLLAMLVWGLVDFDGFFTMFHRLAFTNDLWLLDPATDLLIRLMPIEFFIAYACIAAGTFLIIPVLLVIVPECILRKERKQYAKQSDRL